MAEYLEVPHLIPRLERARATLLAEGQVVSCQALATKTGIGLVAILFGVARERAWEQLGLDREAEFLGPGVTTWH